VFIISFLHLVAGSPASISVPHDPSARQQILVVLVFLPFLLGYLILWKNEAIGGAIFVS
jgi:hypothetical protein